MQRTKIEQLTHSWNPIAMRCTPTSPGCANCWHIALAKRLAGNPQIAPELREAYAGGKPVLVESRLTEPLRLRKPAVIGVQWMGDLFHDDIPFEFVEKVFSTMVEAKQHSFLVLTKRPSRMLEWQRWEEDQQYNTMDDSWFPNVEFGVTVENQKTADERRDAFKALPASKKFVSYEPALGPVDWTGWEFIDQLIFGGETGHGARPAHPDWFRNARAWAGEHGIARFFKSWGAWLPNDQFEYGLPDWRGKYGPDGWQKRSARCHHWIWGFASFRVGKKRSGRLLDGRTWDEMPRRQ